MNAFSIEKERAATKKLTGLYVADCVDFMDAMPNDCVDLVITSPPYDDLRNYNGYKFDFPAIAQGLFKVIKQGGVVVWVVGDRINGGKSLTSFRQGIILPKNWTRL
jgi:site-specific DNA-methyltransferase (adenine-specific)